MYDQIGRSFELSCSVAACHGNAGAVVSSLEVCDQRNSMGGSTELHREMDLSLW